MTEDERGKALPQGKEMHLFQTFKISLPMYVFKDSCCLTGKLLSVPHLCHPVRNPPCHEGRDACVSSSKRNSSNSSQQLKSLSRVCMSLHFLAANAAAVGPKSRELLVLMFSILYIGSHSFVTLYLLTSISLCFPPSFCIKCF